MQQLRLALLLLRPSPFSLVTTIILGVGVLGFANYTYFTRDRILHDYFYGPHGMVPTFQAYVDDAVDRFSFIVGQSLLYNVTVLIAALVAGVTVYIVLQGMTKLLSSFLTDYISVQDATESEKKHIAAQTGVRWLLRGGVLLGWILYWVLFAGVILPFCIIFARVGVSDLQTIAGWVYGFAGLAILIASIHMHVIFMRALVLRPRLFGGENEMVEAMARHSIETSED